MKIPGLIVIGERINPGFKSIREMIEKEDFAAIQEVAVKQRDAGAAYLDFDIGPRGKDDPAFLTAVIEAVQAAVDVPLSFDVTDVEVQETCLKSYDADKAGGRKPIVNSIAEPRQDMLDLLRIRPCKVILMSSERLEDGTQKQNKTSAEMVMTVKRLAERLLGGDYGIVPDDLFVDVAVRALSSDTEGLVRNAIETTRMVASDPDLKGIHVTGALTNLSVQLPAKQVDGEPLKLQLENAFLTTTVPLGFDSPMVTPWRNHHLLSDDNNVLQAFNEIVALDGFDALRRLRKLYTE